MEDLLVLRPHVHEDRLDRVRDAEPEQLRPGLRLAVREDDEQATLRRRREEVRRDHRDEGGEAERAAALVRLARRRLVDADRLRQRVREERGVGRRHEVGQRPVRERRDADRDVAEDAAELPRDPLRADEPGGQPRAGGREHRARRVEDEERLRVAALAHELPPDDHRLRRRDADENGEERERDDRGHERPPARTDDAEHGAHVAAPPLGDEQRRERQRGREREERAERREERDAEERDEHQYPLPSCVEPCPRPKPKPACASLPIGPLPGRVTRRTSSRFCFAAAFVGSSAIACWK